MAIFKRLDTALDSGISKAVFDHLRNFLICAFLLAIGTNEFREHTSIFFGFVQSKYSGLGVIGISCLLIALNLYDGIRKISKTKYHVILTIGLITLYLFLYIRVIEMAWNFRTPF
ncbi:MAG: hypothetical protein JKY76_04830 [Proteobacteria bacterium]|nr:hypothetical protein [Pseudomonadota bacterium]